MYGNPNPSVIPSVQVGAGIPLQSTSANYGSFPQPSTIPAQASIQASNMNPVTSGSMLAVPPGTMVPVRVGNSIVHVPTQPVATQSVQMSVPVPPPAPVQVETQYVPQEPEMDPQWEPAPHYPQTTTPMLKTLPPKVVRNQLTPKYNTVTLPAKVITTRLPPIGPPPTPELNIPMPPPPTTVTSYQPPMQTVVVPETTTVQTLPIQTVQPVQSVIPVAQATYNQTVNIPVTQTVPATTIMPQYQISSVPVPTYQTQMVQPVGPKFGTSSVQAQY